MSSKLPPNTVGQIQRLILRWPKDPIRPESVSVQRYLQSRLEPPRPQSSDFSLTSYITSFFSRSKPQSQGDASLQPPLLSQENIKVLQSFLDNKYQKGYPLRKNVRYPASMPQHYDRLIKEFDEAANRSAFARLGRRIGGSVRLK
ncbi:hypothetical protein H112_08491 [Trichophyton rubrum D6]|uniref:Uncharacterized protein n=4 Tax=Trichophyton TaxID=5550 RepID=F2SEQ4_TRIRC|nr:uncharacterized protein TERG_01051 [Trichophyton rubrum CBS 118892]EZF10301.1 hypothetical protein H100_08513 [Trichophyton rubrum MR850]EZF37193.1 hypothetical protein H102_08473 [Trichophyton rubrum CBS 100081]EZF47754.1 hypothetical protein H103_08494 [Trichophyton rubrum CBS 288.86]EZF58545.1 hypothetical protein H104_08448 [Trichophyton rubrum CBS 289.86]EZF68951.1 hypothetical protein H105_08501 [Trichophyton soudanense CBS 452.61]EZF79673.1 hypothetical protein H110_08498 [Trichophy